MGQNTPNQLALSLRRDDYDHFLAAQLAPVAKRDALYAIAAFHYELARVAEIVSEPLIGHIRLAWWREGLDELLAGKKPRGHPVMVALAEVLKAWPDIAPLLYQTLDACATDLDGSAQDHTPAAGALHMAWALVLDAAAAREHEHAIRAGARAYARGEPPVNVRLPRSLKPLQGMAALAKLRASGRQSRLARVWRIIVVNII